MRRKAFIIIIYILVSIYGYSQTISVSSFKLLDTDLTANTAGTIEVDQNGETAALIKVVTTQTGFTFDGGALGIVKTKQTPGEIWVYIPRGSKKISIKHPQLGVLRDYYFPVAIEAARTYEMKLTTGEVQTLIKKTRTSQYVIFQLTPSNAIVELDGELLETNAGVASKLVKLGTYNYRVKAPNYFPEAGSVTIDDPDKKKVVNVSLKPNYVEVSISVDNNAEIWINNEKRGEGAWIGNLGAGSYEFEARKDGHRSTILTREIIVANGPQTIQLQAPSPIYGEADINSNPAMADIYIDGERIGQTPQLISKLLIGEHTITIQKSGFESESKLVHIKEGELQNISFELKVAKTSNVQGGQSSNIVSSRSQNVVQYPKESAPGVLKKILKSKTISNLEYNMKMYVSQLNIEDRATAYNHLVDWAFEEFNNTNDEKIRPKWAYNAVWAGVECDKYDQMLDKNGKPFHKYSKKNAERLWLHPRNQLINAGQEALNAGDEATARKYWELFAESSESPMFKNCDPEPQRPFLGQIAYYAASMAFQDKDIKSALHLADIAMKDPLEYEKALKFKIRILDGELKTKKDSIEYCNHLIEAYSEYKNDDVLEKLYKTLLGLGATTEATKVVDFALSQNPQNAVALTGKGMILLNANSNEAVTYLNKAFSLQPDNPVLATYVGTAYYQWAQGASNSTQRDELLKKSISFYDKAKMLDPSQAKVKWGYRRYKAYYTLYGEDALETKRAEADYF